MIEKVVDHISQRSNTFFDVAVMTDAGIEFRKFGSCHKLQNNYSITKLFMNTALGVLYDRGEVRLDDKLTDLLRDQITFEYDPAWDGVTLEHALTHSMGIKGSVVDVDRDADVYDVVPDLGGDYLRLCMSAGPSAEPGSVRVYTDVPHYLISRVISAKTGMPADEFLRLNITNPMHFQPVAFQRCSAGFTIGSTGSFMTAADVVKLGWLYMNHGVWEGRSLISAEWVSLCESRNFDLAFDEDGFFQKGGMLGQRLVYNRDLRVAAAWHSFEGDMEGLERCIAAVVSE